MNSMINRSMQGGVAALAVLFGTAAMAQQDSSPTQEKSSKQSTAQSEQKQKASSKRADSGQTAGATGQKSAQKMSAVVVGDVLEMRTTNLKGREGAHQLIKVKMHDGNTSVIDAGPAQAAAAATKDLQAGDRIVAVGRAGRINDRPVLMARSIGELYATGVTGSKPSAAASSKRGTD